MKEVEERIVELYGAKVSVFSDGSVWIHRGSRNKRRFGCKTDKGYMSVLMREHGKMHTVFVHRLVAMAFIPNPENKPQINHKDGNKINNAPDNLEWCSNAENCWHKVHILGSMSSASPVMCVETGEKFKTISEAARQKKVNRAGIQRCLRYTDHNYTTAGLHWERLEVS